MRKIPLKVEGTDLKSVPTALKDLKLITSLVDASIACLSQEEIGGEGHAIGQSVPFVGENRR
ncbi:hypothetical protein [Alkalibacterium sp.]|uniref:hypothetical protein n=1 Tax=Alkalibacterium sp. TaxID=1872447 RepID=UPI0039710863